MKKYFFILLALSLWSCTRDSETEKYQNNRDNILNVKDRIVKIEMEEVPITDFATPYILNDYLIVSDYKSPDKLIHIFNKNNFKYITSIGDRGQGPNEIANIGDIGINEEDHIFYVIDHGKKKIFNFNIDSVIDNTSYFPKENIFINKDLYPRSFEYINDSLSIGIFIKGLDNSDYMPVVAKWNIGNGDMTPMDYTNHPEIKRKRTSFSASKENNLYAECYWYNDLITLGYLTGEFKCNIYGDKWDKKNNNINGFFEGIVFCKDKIVASYLGDKRVYMDDNGGQHAIYPTKFMIFDKNGEYISTLETEHPITVFCYDESNNRIIITTNDDLLFAYLDLKGII